MHYRTDLGEELQREVNMPTHTTDKSDRLHDVKYLYHGNEEGSASKGHAGAMTLPEVPTPTAKGLRVAEFPRFRFRVGGGRGGFAVQTVAVSGLGWALLRLLWLF